MGRRDVELAGTTHVALLRGINVGGRNRVAMAALRAALTDRGLADVRTYVQSGNVVCTARSTDPSAVAALVRVTLAEDMGVPAAVAVVTAERFAAIAAANPFAAQGDAAPTTVHVGFLTAVAPDETPPMIDDVDRFAPEALAVGPGVLYLHLPDGMGRSRLAEEVARRYATLEPTLRNWRTVRALLELIG